VRSQRAAAEKARAFIEKNVAEDFGGSSEDPDAEQVAASNEDAMLVDPAQGGATAAADGDAAGDGGQQQGPKRGRGRKAAGGGAAAEGVGVGGTGEVAREGEFVGDEEVCQNPEEHQYCEKLQVRFWWACTCVPLFKNMFYCALLLSTGA
jgi:hypothetical protein